MFDHAGTPRLPLLQTPNWPHKISGFRSRGAQPLGSLHARGRQAKGATQNGWSCSTQPLAKERGGDLGGVLRFEPGVLRPCEESGAFAHSPEASPRASRQVEARVAEEDDVHLRRVRRVVVVEPLLEDLDALFLAVDVLVGSLRAVDEVAEDAVFKVLALTSEPTGQQRSINSERDKPLEAQQ